MDQTQALLRIIIFIGRSAIINQLIVTGAECKSYPFSHLSASLKILLWKGLMIAQKRSLFQPNKIPHIDSKDFEMLRNILTISDIVTLFGLNCRISNFFEILMKQQQCILERSDIKILPCGPTFIGFKHFQCFTVSKSPSKGNLDIVFFKGRFHLSCAIYCDEVIIQLLQSSH